MLGRLVPGRVELRLRSKAASIFAKYRRRAIVRLPSTEEFFLFRHGLRSF